MSSPTLSFFLTSALFSSWSSHSADLPLACFSDQPVPFTSTFTVISKIFQHSHLNYCNSLWVGLLCNQFLYDPNHFALCYRINQSFLCHNVHHTTCLFANAKWFLFHAGIHIPSFLKIYSSISTAHHLKHVMNLPPSFFPPGYLLLFSDAKWLFFISHLNIILSSLLRLLQWESNFTPSVFITSSLFSATSQDCFLKVP